MVSVEVLLLRPPKPTQASLMADVVAVFVWMGVVVILAGASWLALGYQARRAALTWCSIEKDVGERCVAVVAGKPSGDDDASPRTSSVLGTG